MSSSTAAGMLALGWRVERFTASPSRDLICPSHQTQAFAKHPKMFTDMELTQSLTVGTFWGSICVMALEMSIKSKGYLLASGCSAHGVIVCFQIVVPPLPGKALKRQLPFRGDEGIFEESFIEERRQGLEQFINK